VVQFDPEAEPELPVPDHVPDELTDRYGSSARRTVRRSRTWRYPVARRLRPVRRMLSDGDLWLATLAVFAWSIVAAGALGAVVYLTILVPAAALTVVVPLLAILAVSVVVAVRLVRRGSAIESERTSL
jgi:hypothetical protein